MLELWVLSHILDYFPRSRRLSGTLRLGTASRATKSYPSRYGEWQSRANSSLSSFSTFSLDQLDLDQVKVYDNAKALTEMLLWRPCNVSACGNSIGKNFFFSPSPRGASTKTSMLSVSISTEPNPWPRTIFRFTIITIDLVALLPSAFSPKQYEFYEAIDHLKEARMQLILRVQNSKKPSLHASYRKSSLSLR